ncbi:MAG: ORF6N domain-containing protein [Acidaminococcaceae bacterium]|nr:ORF6N domain-containing protein [Acidaminococcaceae bacterium]
MNRAMKRNIKRFPESFCFQLTADEILRYQIGIPMQKRGLKGGRTYLPYVYTEQGAFFISLHQNFIECTCKLCYNTVAEGSCRSERQVPI